MCQHVQAREAAIVTSAAAHMEESVKGTTNTSASGWRDVKTVDTRVPSMFVIIRNTIHPVIHLFLEIVQYR